MSCSSAFYNLLKIPLALVLVVFASVSTLANNEGRALNKDFETTQARLRELETQLAYKRDIEARAEEITNNLCYALEFRKKHGLNLYHPLFLNEDRYILREWNKDPQLRDSFLEWMNLYKESLKSIWGPHSGFVLSRSDFTLVLLASDGFKRATQACSQRLGIDIEEKLRSGIVAIEQSVSATGNLATYAAIGKIFSVLAQRMKPLGVFKKIPPKVAKGAKLGLLTTAVVAPTGLWYYGYRADREEKEKMLNILLDTEPQEDHWNYWQVRAELMYKFLDEFDGVIDRTLQTKKNECPDPARHQNFFKTLKFFNQSREDLMTLTGELELELDKQARAEGFADAKSWSQRILKESSRPNDETREQVTYDKARFYTSAQTLLVLLDMCSQTLQSYSDP